MVGTEVIGQSGSRPQSEEFYAQNLEAGKDKEMNTTLEPLEGTQSCQDLDLSPLMAILNF